MSMPLSVTGWCIRGWILYYNSYLSLCWYFIVYPVLCGLLLFPQHFYTKLDNYSCLITQCYWITKSIMSSHTKNCSPLLFFLLVLFAQQRWTVYRGGITWWTMSLACIRSQYDPHPFQPCSRVLLLLFLLLVCNCWRIRLGRPCPLVNSGSHGCLSAAASFRTVTSFLLIQNDSISSWYITFNSVSFWMSPSLCGSTSIHQPCFKSSFSSLGMNIVQYSFVKNVVDIGGERCPEPTDNNL